MGRAGVTPWVAAARRSAARPPVVAASVWAAVFATLSLTGQGYSTRMLYVAWQLVPAEAAADSPLGSVWNLHVQPPLWNLLVGAIAAWSPLDLVTSHRLVSLVAGTCLAAALAATLGHLGASRRVAIGLTLVATLNTLVLQHAFEPRYELPLATLLAVLVWTIARQIGTDRPWSLLGPSVAGTAIVLTRALYHPVWLAIVLALLAVVWRRRLDRRRATLAIVIPVLLVGGWIVKNAVVFDTPAMSSWTGMNLLRSVSPAVDPERLAELHRDGRVGDVAVIGLFEPVDDYAEAVPCELPADAHPAVAIATRTVPPGFRDDGPFGGDTVPNYNHRCYLGVYDAAGRDATDLSVAAPGAWLLARGWSVNNWFEADVVLVADTSPLWRPLDVASSVATVSVPHPGLPDAWRDDWVWVHATHLTVVGAAATAALLVGAAARRRSLTSIRRAEAGALDAGADGTGGPDPDPDPDPTPALVLVVAATILVWTAAVGIVAELGEQARFRSSIDPLVLALGGLVALGWCRRRSDRPVGPGAAAETDPAP